MVHEAGRLRGSPFGVHTDSGRNADEVYDADSDVGSDVVSKFEEGEPYHIKKLVTAANVVVCSHYQTLYALSCTSISATAPPSGRARNWLDYRPSLPFRMRTRSS